jgi:Ca2+-transporting ATPase
MGIGGTQAARDVADVILEADDLQTMLLTVSRGRTTYSNIRKAIHYLLATNMSEIIVVATTIATGLGQPLNPMQLLWINLLSDIFPGLALAVEPPEPDVLQRPPRDPAVSIVAWSDFKRLGSEAAVLSAGALASYGYGRLRYGPGVQANTLAFMSLSSAQILHALSCRSERHSLLQLDHMEPNPYLTLAVGGSIAVQALAASVPGLRSFLGLTPLGPADLLVVVGGAVGPLLINELTKGSNKRRRAEGV